MSGRRAWLAALAAALAGTAATARAELPQPPQPRPLLQELGDLANRRLAQLRCQGMELRGNSARVCVGRGLRVCFSARVDLANHVSVGLSLSDEVVPHCQPPAPEPSAPASPGGAGEPAQ